MGASRMRTGRLVVAVASATLLVGATVGSGEEQEASVVQTGGASQPNAVAGSAGSTDSGDAGDGDSSGAKQAKVGDTVKLGDWEIRVNDVTDPVKSSNEFMTPEAGNRWVSVNATVSNKSDKPETVSSMMCFDLRDAEGQKFETTITGSTGSQLDGEVPAGGRLKGSVAFEVPESVKSGLELHFKCDLLSSGSAIISLGK